MHPSAARLLSEAAAALSAHRHAEAVGLCRQVLAEDPDNLQGHVLWAAASLPGEDYLGILDRIHQDLCPRTYVEIGVETGQSLVLARPGTTCIGIDPEPRLAHAVPPSTSIFFETSDAFFAQHDLFEELGGRPVELAFLDGMHHFDCTLRDFVNIERYCAPEATCLLHDCYPLDERTAANPRASTFWSGDTWKIIPCLKKYRPDLRIHTVATAPTGLAIVRGLDPQSTVLRDRLAQATAEFAALPYAYLDGDKAAKLNLVPNDWPELRVLLH